MPHADGPVPVVVLGLGQIGQEIVRAAFASPELELVGAVDVRDDLRGKLLSQLVGAPVGGLKVQGALGPVLAEFPGAVVLQATGSRLPEVMEQLLECVRLGASVVSTCEELAFPYLRHPELSEKLDRAAQKAKVSVLGTGVNPGFVMDRLPALLGLVCGDVRHVKVERVVDARTRREALQRKVGAGLSVEAFDDRAEKEQMGHVGLVESAALCALGLGLDCDDFEEELVAVIAEEDIPGAVVKVKKGEVAGIHQTAVGLSDGQERVRLELTIAVGADDPRDTVVLDAEPRVEVQIPGGIAGDRATAQLVVNAAPRVRAAEPGLLTVLELPAGR